MHDHHTGRITSGRTPCRTASTQRCTTLLTTVLTTCAVSLFAVQPAAAQPAPAYPSKPIRFLIPAAPGGAVDTVGRVLADKLTVSMGRAIVPENRAGAGTMVASEALANSPADGYTVLIMTSSHAINAGVRSALRYDSIKDFATVALLASVPDLLVVNAASPLRSVADLIAAAKKDPGKITFGSAGMGSGSHMDGELFRSLARVDLLHVPYRAGIPAVTALLGNEVQTVFLAVPGLVAHVKSGRLRPLAVTSKERSALLPDVPTMVEAGVPGYAAASWYGAVVPARTPPAIIATLNARLNEALKLPDVREKLGAAGLEPIGSTADYFGTYLKDDVARWQKLVEQMPQLKVND